MLLQSFWLEKGNSLMQPQVAGKYFSSELNLPTTTARSTRSPKPAVHSTMLVNLIQAEPNRKKKKGQKLADALGQILVA
jgi:hypothetical protein